MTDVAPSDSETANAPQAETAPPVPSDPFAAANAALAALGQIEPIAEAAAFQPLNDLVWMTFATEAGVRLALEPGPGLTLVLEDIGRSDWLELACRLDLAAARRGRYLGIRIEATSVGMHSYRPCLRYLMADGGFHDVFARDYIVSAGGTSDELSVIPFEAARLAEATGLELHLFFQGQTFRIDLRAVEALLIG